MSCDTGKRGKQTTKTRREMNKNIKKHQGSKAHISQDSAGETKMLGAMRRCSVCPSSSLSYIYFHLSRKQLHFFVKPISEYNRERNVKGKTLITDLVRNEISNVRVLIIGLFTLHYQFVQMAVC